MCLRLLVVHQALKCGLRLTLAGIRTRGWTLVVTVGPSGVSPLLVVRKGTVTLSPTFATACLLPLIADCTLHLHVHISQAPAKTSLRHCLKL